MRYRALVTTIVQRGWWGISFLGAYTLSKSLVSGGGYTGLGDDAAGSRPLDTNNRRIEKRIAGFDTPHNLVLSWGYELPFGKGKRFLQGGGRAANALLGGWQVNAIQRYVSGTPVGIGGGGVIPLSGGGNRPDRVAGGLARTSVSRGSFDPARDRYLDINAFAQPAPFTLGNAPPALPNVRAFGLFNEDFSILKDIHIFEAHRLQFRAEFFNIFNRVVFGGPSGNINAPATFGRIGGQANSPRNSQLGLKYIF